MRSIKDTMLCWNPNTDQVALVPHPDYRGLSDNYIMTSLAAYAVVNGMSRTERQALAFSEAMKLIVRDGCDPHAVHQAMMGLEEYRNGCAPDMPKAQQGVAS